LSWFGPFSDGIALAAPLGDEPLLWTLDRSPHFFSWQALFLSGGKPPLLNFPRLSHTSLPDRQDWAGLQKYEILPFFLKFGFLGKVF